MTFGKMHAAQIGLLLLLLGIDVLAISLKRVKQHATQDDSQEWLFDDFLSGLMNQSATLFISDENGNPTVESIDCADMNSIISRTLKWMLSNNVDPNKTVNMRFQFSSRKQTRRVEVTNNDADFSLDKTDFDPHRRTVVIVHGFLNGGSQSWIKKMEEAFLLWDDVNVVVVDWSAIGRTVNYYKAAISTRIVGYEIAKLLNRVVSATIAKSAPKPVKWGKLHFVGHSLGSHISGVAGLDLQKMQKHWAVSRITGLDPALPCFKEVLPLFRLDPADAEFVDVIHTSSTEKLTVGFGTLQPLGHVDFYPNGGKRQPGCHRVQGSIFDYIWIPKTPVAQGTCSHSRAQAYFTESLLNASKKGGCKFWAHKWDLSYPNAASVVNKACSPSTCSEMGIGAENYPHRGTFFLTTAKKSPFCVTTKESIQEVMETMQEDM